MKSFPFDSHVVYDETGAPVFDRAINSKTYRYIFRELFKSGIMPTPSTNLQVISGEGMNVIVLPGFAMVDGCMSLEEDNRTLSLQSSDTQYDRIDTVVLRLNANDSYRLCDLYVVEGVPSINPIRPDLTREGDIYELGLADVFISKNSSVLSDSKITDTRYEAVRCGVISSLSEFDTETLNNQMNVWSEEERARILEWEAEQQADFKAWVDFLKTILDESTAGHLQNEIEELRLPATNEKLGLVKSDNVTTEINENGEVVVKKATTETLGIVKSDNVTTEINENGEVVAKKATSTRAGIVEADGTTTDIENGVVSAKKATSSTAGIVEADGTTTSIENGVISARKATSSTAGIVEADNESTHIDEHGVISAVDTYPSIYNEHSKESIPLNTENSFIASMNDLVAGTSELPSGTLYFVYE